MDGRNFCWVVGGSAARGRRSFHCQRRQAEQVLQRVQVRAGAGAGDGTGSRGCSLQWRGEGGQKSSSRDSRATSLPRRVESKADGFRALLHGADDGTHGFGFGQRKQTTRARFVVLLSAAANARCPSLPGGFLSFRHWRALCSALPPFTLAVLAPLGTGRSLRRVRFF